MMKNLRKENHWSLPCSSVGTRKEAAQFRCDATTAYITKVQHGQRQLRVDMSKAVIQAIKITPAGSNEVFSTGQ